MPKRLETDAVSKQEVNVSTVFTSNVTSVIVLSNGLMKYWRVSGVVGDAFTIEKNSAGVLVAYGNSYTRELRTICISSGGIFAA